MGWSTLYDNSDGCRLAFTALFDDFYKLNWFHANATDADLEQTAKIFNVTAIVSSSYKDTIYECYNF